VRALVYAPGEPPHYFAQLCGYQLMPDHELFSVTAVTLIPAIDQIISRPNVRVNCSVLRRGNYQRARNFLSRFYILPFVSWVWILS